MAKAYLSLIKAALDAGYSLNVFDGEDEFKGLGYKAAKDAIEAVEEARLELYKDGKYSGYAYILPYGVDDEESVADYSVPADGSASFIDDWFNEF